MKAAEMPINMIVIIMIIALVALAIIGFFTLGFNPAGEGMGMQAKKQAGCLQWGCNIDIDPVNIEIGDTNLELICVDFGEVKTAADFCNKTCNCNWK